MKLTNAPKETSRKKTIKHQLTPAKLDTAWEKVCKVVQDVCKLRGCTLCEIAEARIELQLRPDHPLVRLERSGDRIRAKICNRQWIIRIVRLTTSGSAYEFRRQRFSATRLIDEIIRRGQTVEKSRKSRPSVSPDPKRHHYVHWLVSAVQRYDRELAELTAGGCSATEEPASEEQFQLQRLTAHREQILAELRDLGIEAPQTNGTL